MDYLSGHAENNSCNLGSEYLTKRLTLAAREPRGCSAQHAYRATDAPSHRTDRNCETPRRSRVVPCVSRNHLRSSYFQLFDSKGTASPLRMLICWSLSRVKRKTSWGGCCSGPVRL